uniref:Putative ATPase domain containing protein n=1 Tax=viral metagenome TaxID=1070528 RepID=A0A6M3JPC0_9ZZZZ
MFTGIVTVTGEHDTGKTTLGLEAGAPSRTYLLDDDVKGRSTYNDLALAGVELGRYTDLTAAGRGRTELAFHNYCMGLIRDIKDGEFDVLMWDTWTRFQQSFHPYVKAHPSEFRATWALMGKIKGPQMWNEASLYEAAILNELQQKVPLVILNTHLKDDYVGGQKTGKMKPAHGKTLARVSRLRIWLRHNPRSPVPIALVLKRLDEKRLIDGRLRTVAVLPRKVTPRPWPITDYLDSMTVKDESLWDTFQWYQENPVGHRLPFPEETPNEYELSILDGTLTDEQKLVLRSAIQSEKIEEVETVEMANVARERARELSEGGDNYMTIVEKMRGEVEGGGLTCDLDDVTVMNVMQWVK